MNVDRALQLRILHLLKERHPESVGQLTAQEIGEIDPRDLAGNLVYLAEHRLIAIKSISYGLSGGLPHLIGISITAPGIDFLEGDGGLTAILSVVKVKLHEEDLRRLIETRIQQLPATPADKQKLLDRLRSLPADAIRHGTLKLVEQGLQHVKDIPALVRTLQDWLQ